MRAIHFFTAALAFAAFAAPSWAQQPGGLPRGTPAPNTVAKATKSVETTRTFRADKLQGMKVKNPEGEELGTINDLVIDMENHQVRYAALSYGGFLGIGDKLFAVPIDALQLKHDGDNSYFVVDIDKETLKNAPGFAKDAWPNFADATWLAGMEKHYGRYAAWQGTVESTADGRLTITDSSNRQHSFNIGPNVRITSRGEKAQLKDLQQGQHAKVTTTERDGKQVVTAIQGSDADRTARRPTEPTTVPRN